MKKLIFIIFAIVSIAVSNANARPFLCITNSGGIYSGDFNGSFITSWNYTGFSVSGWTGGTLCWFTGKVAVSGGGETDFEKLSPVQKTIIAALNSARPGVGRMFNPHEIEKDIKSCGCIETVEIPIDLIQGAGRAILMRAM